MSNVSVTDILKIHGKWIQSSKFTDLIGKKLKISERQAIRLIKKDTQILKLVLPDRTVLYGLAEFGLPKTELPKIPSSILNLALESGVITQENVKLISNVDFFLNHPGLIGAKSEERTYALSILKLIREFHLQKIKSLKSIEESLK